MKVEGTLEKYYHYAFPMQTVLVTCNDDGGKTNIITLAWHTPISRKPPYYGISIGPKRYSHGLIEQRKEFVINFIPYSLVEAAQFCGTHSGKTTDKLFQTGLSLVQSSKVNTPSIKEGYAHLECTLVKSISLGDHTLFVGEVVAVSAYTTLDRVKRKAF
jgi:flavin reductase (DIM6/NTAB) family NADH-FMN oxidoreductase RutF